ncbi:MAG: DJ-1/PfpI family protein [Candidatus Ancillula sp.]|jgi:putative intracellular protease/amidase|nr:DJ-1/PfpI family protein [Candidatus Ancillula sp.]
MKKRVLVLAFDGCEDIEFVGFVDVLTRCGIECRVISAFNSEFITTKSGLQVDYDAGYAKFGYLCLDDGYDALYVPGGAIDSEFKEFMKEHSSYFNEQVADFVKGGGLVVANCIAPALLAKHHAFDFKPDYLVTCYPGGEVGNIAKEHHVAETVYDDGQILSGNGPSATVYLAELTASRLLDESATASKVLTQMGFK